LSSSFSVLARRTPPFGPGLIRFLQDVFHPGSRIATRLIKAHALGRPVDQEATRRRVSIRFPFKKEEQPNRPSTHA